MKVVGNKNYYYLHSCFLLPSFLFPIFILVSYYLHSCFLSSFLFPTTFILALISPFLFPPFATSRRHSPSPHCNKLLPVPKSWLTLALAVVPPIRI